MATDNLDITELTASQSNKYATFNTAIEQLDIATQDTISHAISGDETITAAEFRDNTCHILTGTPGSPFALNLPLTISRQFSVINNTDSTCTVQLTGPTGDDVTMLAGSALMCWTNGTNVYQLANDGGGFFEYRSANLLGSISGSTNLDLSNNYTFTCTLTGATGFVFLNPPATDNEAVVILQITAGGGKTITWPSSIIWASGSAPSLHATLTDVIEFRTINGGDTWWGIERGLAFA